MLRKRSILPIVFILNLSTPVLAEDCSWLLNDLTAYASKVTDVIFHPGSYKVVKVKMATNRADSRYVSYAEGQLKRYELYLTRLGSPILVGQGLRGDSTQMFSDRVASLSNPSCSDAFCFPYTQPFSTLHADALGIEISVDAKVTLTLNSWGGGTVKFNAACSNGILYGSTPDGTFFTFSFAKAEISGNPS